MLLYYVMLCYIILYSNILYYTILYHTCSRKSRTIRDASAVFALRALFARACTRDV